MKLLMFIFILVFSSGIKSDELLISSKINAVLPDGMSVQSIKESQIENLFIVDIGDLQPIYASACRFFRSVLPPITIAAEMMMIFLIIYCPSNVGAYGIIPS